MSADKGACPIDHSYESSLRNCYAMARRQIRRYEKRGDADSEHLMAWRHVLRFCEEAGLRPDILRDAPAPAVDAKPASVGLPPGVSHDDIYGTVPASGVEEALDELIESVRCWFTGDNQYMAIERRQRARLAVFAAHLTAVEKAVGEERERCAGMCDIPREDCRDDDCYHYSYDAARKIAAAIRGKR